MALHVYRLEPVAEPDDPNWDRANNFGSVLVCAESPADARVVAAAAEADWIRNGAGTDQAAMNPFSSAFSDAKLYRVTEEDSGRFAGSGRRVLEGITSGKAI